MKTRIVLAHREPKSFNGHVSQTTGNADEGAEDQVTLSDLYAMDFDPREGMHHFPNPRVRTH